jgi:photosystem II stability/assembly factor-like uncharacterized protein
MTKAIQKIFSLVLFLSALQASAQTLPDSILKTLQWRNIGPFRAGRSLAVSGDPSNNMVYYFGATGGGVWKSTDAGANWACVSDTTFKSSSVGAIMVAPSDPNIVYVGMGEADMRSNISFGDGMYKSMDAGKSWKAIGPKNADAIANIEVHPTNPNIVYMSAMGNPFAPNKERGIYRTLDGGKTWKLVLSKNDSTGGMCVKMDPNNERILYATLWQAYRNGYSMSSGGKGSGLYKSVDGGDTWTCLNQQAGMPTGILGKIGICVSPKNSNRLYALIENKNGGLFRSDDAGESWTIINSDKNLWQRPWYYMNLAADPQNENGVFVLNVNAWRSTDGGKSFKVIPVRHGDTHDIWINPKNAENFIIGDDGGAEVTFNGGAYFSDIDIPTAQFYHVNLDNDYPYHVYGAQQDNSSIRIASRTDGYSIGNSDWYPVAGGEAGYIVPHPKNSLLTFGGEYDGFLSKYNKATEQYQDISVYPETNIGSPSAAKKYRFQWTYPIVVSPHNSERLYVTSQFVHRSDDQGYSWTVVSPDLSRNDPKTTGPTGGPITKDMTGAEVYATIFAFAESKIEKGVLYAGSDDGLLHVSTDDASTWKKISIPTNLLPEFSLISIIHPSEFEKGKVYVAANKYMFGDKKPYLFKSTDYGKTWKLITKGIPNTEYCRVIREDPNVAGLLYAGTECGIYVSFDDGASWQKLNNNLPNTPIRDLQVQAREADLVVATHGRSFWILDDLNVLYDLKKEGLKKDFKIIKPQVTYRTQGAQVLGLEDEGTNAINGVVIHYYLKSKPSAELRLQILSEKGDTIITYSSLKDLKGKTEEASTDFFEKKQVRRDMLSAKAGLNQFVWDMRYPDAVRVEGTNVMWAGGVRGPKVVPGKYTLRLWEGNKMRDEQIVEIVLDPRLSTSAEDLIAQRDLHLKINAKLSETHKGINTLRKARTQIENYNARISDTTLRKEFSKLSAAMIDTLNAIESQLMQPKAKAPQDVLAYPIMLNDKLAGIASNISSAETKPNKNAYEAYDDLSKKIDVQLQKLQTCLNTDIPKMNAWIKSKNIEAITVD